MKRILCIVFCTLMIATVLPVTGFSLETVKMNYFVNDPILTQEPSFPITHSHLQEITKRVGSQPDVAIISNDDVVIDIIQQIDESLVLGYLEALVSFGPRVTGSASCEAAAEYLYNEFQNMGLAVRYQNWSYGGDTSSNVEATIYGTEEESDEIYIICGHYDTVSSSPGADDDASGVVAAMAAAYIMSQYVFNHTIRFVAFSGEEEGLLGSDAYAAEANANGDNIVGVLNADMIGFAPDPGDENSIKVYENAASEWLYTFTSDVNNQYNEYIQLSLIHSGEAWNSDHASFWQYGYDALMYHEYHFNDYYHSSGDTIDHMNILYATKGTRLTIATLAELAHPGFPSNPPYTPTMTGPTTGVINQEYTYNVVTTDPDGDDVYYYVDWGDGTNSGWVGPYNSGQTITISHTWVDVGVYLVKVRAKDIWGARSEWSPSIIVTITDNTPPTAPDVQGPTSGKPGVEYLYSLVSTDAENQDIYYFFDWGDGTNSDWFGPYNSGEMAHTTHSWTQQGTYTVMAKAKDTMGGESDWTTISVTMPLDINGMKIQVLYNLVLLHHQKIS